MVQGREILQEFKLALQGSRLKKELVEKRDNGYRNYGSRFGLLFEAQSSPILKKAFLSSQVTKCVDFGCLVLAAGESKRMGVQKLLLEYKGKPLLTHVIQLVRSLPVKHKVIVLGRDSQKIRSQVELCDFKILENPHYQLGISSSIKLGFQELCDKVDAILVVLGDQPLVKEQTVKTLLVEHEKSKPLATVPTHKGKRGNPVILSVELKERIQNLQGDRGASQLFDSLGKRVLYVEVDDPGILIDIDTSKDYYTLLKQNAFW